MQTGAISHKPYVVEGSVTLLLLKGLGQLCNQMCALLLNGTSPPQIAPLPGVNGTVNSQPDHPFTIRFDPIY